MFHVILLFLNHVLGAIREHLIPFVIEAEFSLLLDFPVRLLDFAIRLLSICFAFVVLNLHRNLFLLPVVISQCFVRKV